MAKEPKLTEDQFIQERYKKDPKGLWYLIAFALLLALISLGIWSLNNWRRDILHSRLIENPFYQVTNRELSLFLWQHPEFMRVNRRSKANYLTGFDYQDRVGVNLESTEKIVQAPPSVLHRYHNWKYLIGDLTFEKIPTLETFQLFLKEAPEWHPSHWNAAPEEYALLLSKLSEENISEYFTLFPKEVQQAFCGWMNYFLEGEQINALEISAGEMRAFLSSFPSYARNYWRNFYRDPEGNTWYLTHLEEMSDEEIISASEIPAYLKAAVFNWLQLRN